MTDTPNADIKKFLPSHFLNVLGKNIPGIISAINTSNAETERLIQACINNLFLSTATGRFLVQLGEQYGFAMPAGSGLDIRAYRVLVPIMASNPKQVRLSINDIVQAFYKNERTKPYLQSEIPGPFSLNDGDDLILETESGRFSINVLQSQVSDLTNVSASEIASIINSSQSLVLAEGIKDRSTGLESLRILSNTSGAGAFIQVRGGKLQNVLKFEKIINTSNSSLTTWNLTKASALADELTFTWNGVGTNPSVFLAKAGDIVTIRGLVNGANPYSLLNGSYEAVDVGYDYFVIRNPQYQYVSSLLTEQSDNSIVFTKNEKITILDRNEFATTSETENQTITVTVPAVPPLTLRFLKGAAHLHGNERDVVDFTRSSIKISVPEDFEKPSEINYFHIKNEYNRYDFSKKFYKTFLADSNLLQPTYQVESNSLSYSVLPYTTPSPLPDGAIAGTVGRDEFVVTFPYRHGLVRTFGFTIAGATAGPGLLITDLNKEHIVSSVLNDYQVAIKILDSAGEPKKFLGHSFGPVDVYRYYPPQFDGSDFYLEFPDQSTRIASGLAPGMIFRLDTAGGTDVNPYYGGILRYRDLVVKTATNNIVTFSSGIGTGLGGLVISGVSGKRSGAVGGASMTQYLDKTTPNNQDRVFSGLKCLMAGYTPSKNPLFVGSYLYDPSGDKTFVTVSKYLTDLSAPVLKGDSSPAIVIDSVDVGDEKFPQSGNIVIDYGTDRYEGPIRYFAVVENPGSNQILIDPAYKFKHSHFAGAKVQYIHDNKAYIPTQDGDDYPFYITGTTESRHTMFTLIKLLVAAGIFVEQDVLLPDLRYTDIALEPFGS